MINNYFYGNTENHQYTGSRICSASLKVSEDHLEEIGKRARHEGISRSAYFNKAVQFYEAFTTDPDMKKPYDPFMDMRIQMVRSKERVINILAEMGIGK